MIRCSIDDAKDAAREKGGVCLSTNYINNKTKMLWRCIYGHTWSACLDKIKNAGNWCPECKKYKLSNSKRLKDGLSISISIAKKNNGKCLSIKYVNMHTKMLWRCSKGHQWLTTLNSIKRGSWCFTCSIGKISERLRLKNGLQIAKDIAYKRGGKCLSKKYTNTLTKMLWQCGLGHKWKAMLGHVRHNNTWCPECAQLKIARSSNYSYILYHWKTGDELVCQASWEKRVVEYLNINKINFRWQPRSFKMPNGKRYYPDMYLYSTKKWIEIKGYFRKDAEEKWNWFQTIKPNSELWNKNKLKEMGIL